MNRVSVIIFILVSFIFSNNIKGWESLSLKEKIGQMIMVRVDGNYYQTDSRYKALFKKWISDYHVGGIITFSGSIHGTFYNIKKFQSWANTPLFVAADYERGLGQWLDAATLFPSNMAIAATGDPNYAFDQGLVTSNEAKSIGVNIILAPVLDINNNPDNPIINFRAYSDDANIVSKYGNSFISGVQKNNIFSCIKHFPGHGNTSIDSHSSLPSILGNKDELRKNELLPFKKAIKNGVKMVMIGHIAMPGLDDSNVPASHSKKITTNLLREEWGFDGLIITDGMEMGGLTENSWAGESAIRAIEAGCDILLLPMDIDATIQALLKAIENGRISIERINQSVERIWKAKIELNLFSSEEKTWDELENNIGKSEHYKIANEIANKSITIIKDVNNLIPVKPEKISKLTHVILSLDDGANDVLKPFHNEISKIHHNVNKIFINDKVSELRIDEIIKKLSSSDLVIVSLLVRIRMDKGIATINDSHAQLLHSMYNEGINFITISFGSPYLPAYNYLDTYITAYGYGSVAMRGCSNVIWGRVDGSGKLPINLNSKYKRGHGVYRNKRINPFDSSKDIKYDLSKAWAVNDSAINVKIFPGAQIFISKSGQIIASQSFGHYTYDSNSKSITNESIYDIASLTKVASITPIIMKLVAMKKIGLEHTLEQFYNNIDGDKKNITIKHLLTHSSGLKPFVEYYKTNKINRDSIIKDILDTKLDFNPGSRFQYSDLGMILLMDIVEEITRDSLDNLSSNWIYKKLGMRNTMFNPDISLFSRIVPTEYDSLFRKKMVHGVVHDENAFLLNGVSGHAGLFSTAEDLGKFGQVMLNKGSWLGNRYFRASLIRKFTKRQDIPIGSERALGWDTPSRNKRSSAGDLYSNNSFGHLGFTGTSIWIDTDNEIVIILLTNRVHPSRKNNRIYGIRRKFHNYAMESIL